MNNSNTSHNLPSPDWQMLGELELPIGSSTEDAIHTWLSKMLDQLHIQTHFLNQILQSAQDAAERALRSDRAAEFQHLHLLVYAPKQNASNVQTWGFFQLEKMEDTAEGENPHDHAIEFFLYPEG